MAGPKPPKKKPAKRPNPEGYEQLIKQARGGRRAVAPLGRLAGNRSGSKKR